MEVSYEWQPQMQMVRVDFGEYLPFKQDLYDQFFSGRGTLVGDNDAWVYVICTLDEWKRYLTFVYGAFVNSGQMELIKQAQEVGVEILEFRKWRAQVESSVAYKPGASEMVA